jgi:L-ribulose-5-phosphate 4-epimerase
MQYQELKQRVWEANMGIVEAGLVVLTWGNASGVDRALGAVAIKPSGVDYDRLRADDIVVLSLETGEKIEGEMKPSSDAPTHLEIYRNFPNVGGIIHTHSVHAASWAQAGREIPCLGTTHADHFYGPIPVTRPLTEAEVHGAYELNTGKVIVERFLAGGIDPDRVPAVLVPGHGPFAWGATPAKACDNAIVLEEVAKMNLYALLLNPELGVLSQCVLNKHFLRKHGPGAYYGQSN